MKSDISEDRLLRTILEVTYNKNNQEKIKKSKRELYPAGWYSLTDRYKINTLSEALKKNCLIKDTDLFKDSIEGVKPIEKLQ